MARDLEKGSMAENAPKMSVEEVVRHANPLPSVDGASTSKDSVEPSKNDTNAAAGQHSKVASTDSVQTSRISNLCRGVKVCVHPSGKFQASSTILTGVLPEHIAAHNRLITNVAATLNFEPSLEQKDFARDALIQLHYLNLRNKRMKLYSHYMRLVETRPLIEAADVSSRWEDTELEKDLKRYSEATVDFESFMKFHEADWNFSSDAWLINSATRLAAIDLLKRKKQQDGNDQDSYQKLIDHAEHEMAELYVANLDTLGSDSTGKINIINEERRAALIKRDERWHKFIAKFSVALYGGLSLIVRMIIMTLHPTLLTILLTTSIFVLFVAAVLSLFMVNAEAKDIVGATAAYAAVLVVFVGMGAGPGTSSSSGGGSSTSDGYSVGATAGIVVGCIVGFLVLVRLLLFIRDTPIPRRTIIWLFRIEKLKKSNPGLYWSVPMNEFEDPILT